MRGRLGPLWRGLRARRGLSAMILLVAVIATAAAAAGPTYYFAAQRSILADTLHAAPTIGQGVETTFDGPLAAENDLLAEVQDARRHSAAPSLLDKAVLGQEMPFQPASNEATSIVWRSGLCPHLHMVTGRCPRRAGDAVVSKALAERNHLAVGDRLALGYLRVVGIYLPVHPDARYWFNRGYFPQEGLFVPVPGPDPVDAVFTVRATFATFPEHAVGTSMVDLLLALDAVTPDRVPALHHSIDQISAQLTHDGLTPVSGIKTALDAATSSWRKLLVPVVLITAQLLALVWLLLFLVITDAAELRGPDIALAKVRGLGRLRTLRFGLAEPVSLLLVALPAGIAVGWAATLALSQEILRPGTAVTIGGWTVAAAAIAVSGGLGAAALAARRIVARPVVEQWRRAGNAVTRRGWALDVALLVATGAGLAELYVSGAFSSASTHVLAVLVPGLLGLAVAVLVARLLPWACRRLFRLTGGHGHIGAFLAVRQVARRPAGMRSLTVLAAAFALACFSISAWTVTRSNIADVAATRTGAAEVLDVLPAPGQDLAATVARLDPSGHHAMAVDDYTDFANASRQTIAVDPARWTHVAFWRADFSSASKAALARRLDPPAADPVMLVGDRLRLTVSGARSSTPLLVEADLKVQHATAPTPVTVGRLGSGTHTLSAPLTGCPCVLRGLELTTIDPTVGATGRAVLAGMATHTSSGWRDVRAGLGHAGRWTYTGYADHPGTVRAASTPHGLAVSFRVPSGVPLSWAAYSWPNPLPALVTTSVATESRKGSLAVNGLDAQPVAIDPVGVVPVPGAPTNAVVVDREYAEREAFDTSVTSTHQVWLTRDVADTFPARLRRAGVRIISVRTAAQADRLLSEQGPALAILLFLADACAAAVLAALGAVAGLHLSARRRRYEIAALRAAGARPGPLRTGLLLEQALVLGLGVLAGVGAGLAGTYLAIPAVPEFVHRPLAPALLYRPDWAVLAVPLAVVAVLVAVAGLLSSVTLVSGANPEQLREDPA